MARKKPTRRIEPSFDAPRARSGTGGLSVSEADRIVPSRRSKSRKASGPKGHSSKRRRSGSGRGKRRGFFGLLRKGVYWSFVLGLWAVIVGAGVVAYYGAKMPSATTWTVPDRPPNVRIVSVDDKLLANRGMTGGEAIGLHEMSPYIPQAVIAIEDRRFYSHFGVDPIGLARAMVENIMEGRITQGGSTLTQQLAKNLFLEPDRTIERKVQEVLMALWLEREHTKDQILEMYLNRVYFGSGAYGVEAASRRYFGKSARDVTLSEAALLAGLLKAPSRLSPARDPHAAEERAQLVLAAMREQGKISDQQMATAMSVRPTRAPSYWTGSENYVADRIMEQLPELIGEVRTDITVETTVDLRLQQMAEKTIRNLIDENGKKLNVSQGALVSMDGTGAIRALVGGYDYAVSQFDRASGARRQPGSAFKPFVFLAALEQGRTPQSIRNDAPIKIGKWTPQNYGGKYYGQVTLSEALARSLNSVAAQLVMEAGPKNVVEVAHRMGIESKLNANASIALGTSEVTPLELTAAYVPLANGGYRPEPYLVRRITSESGKVLYEHEQQGMPRVVSSEIVGMMNAMMSRAIEEGTARKADFGWPAAGKTGTTQDSRDAWFVGYTTNLVTGVWFGNDSGEPTKGITGGGLPAAAWHDFMAAAHKGVPVAGLPGNWTPMAQYDIPGRRPSEPLVSSASGGYGNAGGPPQSVSGTPRPRADVGQTSSIGRPVPPGEVGGAPVRRETSILDIIFGN